MPIESPHTENGKLIALAEAVALIPDGASLSIGGFSAQRHPMAFVYELIRQRKRNLYLFGHSPGGDWDMLIGAGCVKRVELAYEADEDFGTIGPCWRKAVQAGSVEWEDYSNFAMVARFTAGAMGLPFMPVRTMFGSSLLEKEGLTAEQRRADPRTALKKFAVLDSPFAPEGTQDRVVLVPAIHTEFCVLHVQQATRDGMVRIQGQSFADVQEALAAETVIVTAEEIVDDAVLRHEPERNQIPFFKVKYVVHVPYGSHPYAVYGYYDHDPRQLKEYHDIADSAEGVGPYLEKYIYGTPDFAAYLEAIGGRERLAALRADPAYGYSPNLKRRGL